MKKFNQVLSAAAALFLVVVNLLPLSSCEEGQLIFASVIFRHGDRTPVEPYPNDPYKNVSLWPVGFGQLTNTGKQQHYALGKWFRQRYGSLVGKKYDFTQMKVRSTDVDRTLMSAQSNLAGFFPPVEKDVWNDQVNWQPIPVHTMPESQDALLAAKKLCPVYEEQLKALKKTAEFKQIERDLQPIYKFLTKMTGKKVDNIQSVQNVYNTLFIEDLYNFTLPDWTKEVYPEKLKPYSGLSFAIKAYTPLLARLKSGPLLKEILTHMQSKVDGKLDASYYVYSAHDTTVANMLSTLGVFKELGYHNPPYVSSVLFELRKFGDGDFRVQAFYHNTTFEPAPLNLPGCGISCPLSQMFEMYKSVLPVDWEKECTMRWFQWPMSKQNFEDSISASTVFAFIGVMTLSGMIVLYITMRLRRREDYGELF